MSQALKTITVLVFVLALVFSAMSELGFAGSPNNLLFSDDFENYLVGSFPSQWTLAFNGLGNQYQQVISDPLNSSNKCFQLQGERNWAADAVKNFQSNSNIIGFEVSVLVTAITNTTGDNVKVGLWEQVDWGNAKWNDGIAFTDDGTIVARDYVEAEGTGTVLEKYVPNQWYHIKFLLDRPNKLISVYIDGVLKGQLIKGSERAYIFDGLAVSGRYTENLVDYDNVKIFEGSSSNKSLQEPTLTVSCISSSSMSDFKVLIRGTLTFNETGISEAPILISYSVTGGKSWVDLTLAQTLSNGSYYAEWMPSVTGYFSLRAIYEGNNNYSDTIARVNFVVEPHQEQNIFSINSNSTITGFFFDSNSSELSFSVSGNTGTTGYVNVNIPKSLINDISTLKVFLDDTQIDYLAESQGDSWQLHFSYDHSTHLIDIQLSSSSLLPTKVSGFGWLEIAILVFMGILLAATILGVFVFFRKKPQ